MVNSNKTKHKSFTMGRLFLRQDNVLGHLDFYFPVILNVKLKRTFPYHSRTAVSYFIFDLCETFIESTFRCLGSSTRYCFVSVDVTKM